MTPRDYSRAQVLHPTLGVARAAIRPTPATPGHWANVPGLGMTWVHVHTEADSAARLDRLHAARGEQLADAGRFVPDGVEARRVAHLHLTAETMHAGHGWPL